ncbi:hypothetical protein ENBRE01_2874, partial [Enteropsectra breve]
ASKHARCFEEQFKVRIGTADAFQIVDFRDLNKSVPMNEVLELIRSQETQMSSRLEDLIRMNDLYELACAMVEKSRNDTFKKHEALIKGYLDKEGKYDIFERKSDALKPIDLCLSYDLQTVSIVFQMMSSWCTALKLSLNAQKLLDILQVFNFLTIDDDKLTDLFLENNNEPLHLRIKTKHLFSINFVYLLQTHDLLKKYQFICAGIKGACEDINDQKIAWLLKENQTLASYICLLQIEMEKECVSTLNIGSGSLYFVWDFLHEPNSKRIFLTDTDPRAFEYYIRSKHIRFNLIDEINTLNHARRRLEIVLPFFETNLTTTILMPINVPDNYEHTYNMYIYFMRIFTDITEVYVYNFLHLYFTPPRGCKTTTTFDSLLIKTVSIALHVLPALNSLFINGFAELPKVLINELKRKNLEKFGAMSYYGDSDNKIIEQLFERPSKLKSSIRHFVGHFHVLLYLCTMLPENQITHTTSCHKINEPESVLSSDEEEYIKKTKKYYEEENPGYRLNIKTFYYMDSPFLNLFDSRNTLSPPTEFIFPHLDVCGLFAQKVVQRCNIEHLVVDVNANHDKLEEKLATITERGIPSVKTIEFILNNFNSMYFSMLGHAASQFIEDGSCLIFNIDAELLPHAKTDYFFDRDIKGIEALFRYAIVSSRKDVTLIIRFRNLDSKKVDLYHLREAFIEWWHKKNYGQENFENLLFENASYNTDKVCMLKKTRL